MGGAFQGFATYHLGEWGGGGGGGGGVLQDGFKQRKYGIRDCNSL